MLSDNNNLLIIILLGILLYMFLKQKNKEKYDNHGYPLQDLINKLNQSRDEIIKDYRCKKNCKEKINEFFDTLIEGTDNKTNISELDININNEEAGYLNDNDI